MFAHIDRFHQYIEALKTIDVGSAAAVGSAENLRAMIGFDPLLADRDRQELGLRLSILAMQIHQSRFPDGGLVEKK